MRRCLDTWPDVKCDETRLLVDVQIKEVKKAYLAIENLKQQTQPTPRHQTELQPVRLFPNNQSIA